MKKRIQKKSNTLSYAGLTCTMGFLALLGGAKPASAQSYNFSIPIWEILQAGPSGMQLPDGTVVTASQIRLNGTANIDPMSGGGGPEVGGTYNGTVMTGYTGSANPADFTRVTTGNTQTIDNGSGTNCAAGIGFHIHFNRPTLQPQFLTLDLDGTSGINNEWVGYMAFNGDNFVPYTTTIVTPNTFATISNITIGGAHGWRTFITNQISATAAANIPGTLQVDHCTSNPNADPDDINAQTLYTSSSPITDYYYIWGIWGTTGAANTQNSGVSPIVINVSADFGRAPDSYKTLQVSKGASHGLGSGLTLGAVAYPDRDGLNGFGSDTTTDNDGVAAILPIVNSGAASQLIPAYSIVSTYTNPTGNAANYAAWIDWNNNGTFDPAEGVTATSPAGSTSGTVTFTWNNVTLSGASGTTQTYARIRTTTEAITISNPSGSFIDGEVEDYIVPFAQPLPLTLTQFTGKVTNHRASLSWATQKEENTDRFEVEYSRQGNSFSTIGTVKAVGNGAHNYNFTDIDHVNAVNFYRLKMIDKDGQTLYSKIIRINDQTDNAAAATLQLYPNPVTDQLYIQSTLQLPYQLTVYNNIGQAVLQQKVYAAPSAINCSALGVGTYHMLVQSADGQIERKTFIKQ